MEVNHLLFHITSILVLDDLKRVCRFASVLTFAIYTPTSDTLHLLYRISINTAYVVIT